MPQASPIIELPHNYEVVGEHLHDTEQLLILGDNGQLYALNLREDTPSPIELSDDWVLDPCLLQDKVPDSRRA